MEDTVNLLDIYNVLKRYHHHRDKIYANLCSLLAERLHYKIMLVKNVDLEKKGITFYAKKYEEVGDYDIWQELVLRKSGDAYLYRTKDGNNVKINCLFNNTFFLNYFFNELISLREYLLLNNYLIYDVSSLYYLSLSSDEIKISEKNRKVKRIPVSYSKDTSEYNDYLSHIYVDKTNLPLWLQEECELIKQPKSIQTLKRIWKSLSN